MYKIVTLYIYYENKRIYVKDLVHNRYLIDGKMLGLLAFRFLLYFLSKFLPQHKAVCTKKKEGTKERRKRRNQSGHKAKLTSSFITSLSFGKEEILRILRKECLTVFYYRIRQNLRSLVLICSTHRCWVATSLVGFLLDLERNFRYYLYPSRTISEKPQIHKMYSQMSISLFFKMNY